MGDTSSQSLLLEWANNQCRSQDFQMHFYNFQQLKASTFVYHLLQKVHPTFFYQLHDRLYSFQAYFNCIQRYLFEVQGKKIRKSFKKDLCQQESITQILKLLMYLLINSGDKTEFINRIFDMSVEIQTLLMQELKRIHQAIENYIEIKDILTTVEHLQQENQQLRQKLKISDENFDLLHENLQEMKMESKKTQYQIKKYQTEKRIIMQQLNIVDLKDYIDIFKSVRQQNEELYDCIHQVQQRKKEIQNENLSLRQRIYEDCHTITQLNSEIDKYRIDYRQAKEQISELSFSIKDSFQESILRQNKNINNTNKTKRSEETSCSVKTSRILLDLQSYTEPEKDTLKIYTAEMIHKLQIAYKMIGQMGNEISILKQQKRKAQKKNKGFQKKISLFLQQQNRFQKQMARIGI